MSTLKELIYYCSEENPLGAVLLTGEPISPSQFEWKISLHWANTRGSLNFPL